MLYFLLIYSWTLLQDRIAGYLYSLNSERDGSQVHFALAQEFLRVGNIFQIAYPLALDSCK